MAHDSFAGMVLPDDLTAVELQNLDREGLSFFYASVMASREARTKLIAQTEDFMAVDIEWLGHRYRVRGARKWPSPVIFYVGRTHSLAVAPDAKDSMWVPYEPERPQGWGEW